MFIYRNRKRVGLLRIVEVIVSTSLVLIVMYVLPVYGGEGAVTDGRVAVVNGSIISRASFDREMDRLERQLLEKGKSLSSSQVDQLKKKVCDTLINKELLYQESLKKGITVSTVEVDRQLKKIKSQFSNEEEFKNALVRAKFSLKSLKYQIKKGAIIQKFVDQQFVQKVVIPEKEAKAYYDNHKEMFERPEQVRVRHILIKVGPDADSKKKADAYKKIKQIQDKLRKGEDFATLAKEFSECSSSKRGGDLGYFSRGQLVKSFEDAAFALKPGEVSNVVETKFGYHLIKVIDKKPKSIISYKKIKQEIEQYLKQQEIQKELTGYLEKLRANAKIKRFVP